MQQTENYKLNLIDTDDLFGPEALNENTKTLDTTLAAQLARLDAAITAETAAWTAEIARVDGVLAGKAEKTALTAKADQTTLTALTTRVTTLEQGRLRYKYGSYTGTGTYGQSSPNSISVDFTPIALVLGNATDPNYGGLLYLREQSRVDGSPSSSSPSALFMTWGSRSISWYASAGVTIQMNVQNQLYYYLILGTA